MDTVTAKDDLTVGVFRSEAAAQQAVARLRAEGFDESAIHVVADGDQQQNEPGDISDNTITKSNGGLVVGAMIGAVAGIFVGVVLASGLVPLPTLIMGLGPIGITLIVVAIGVALGMLGGSMAGMTQARQETKGLEKSVEAGHWLVSLYTPDTDVARAALQKVGAIHMQVQSATQEPVKPRT